MFDNYEKVFEFFNKTEAMDFIKQIKSAIYKYDVVTVNDVLKIYCRTPNSVNGFHYGYAKKDIKNVKPEHIENLWRVTLPEPGRMIRGVGGHWTTADPPVEGGG